MKKLLHYEINKGFYYENGYFITSNTKRLGKMLAQYELYKKILDIPGEIMEFGVHKGASLIRLATYREILESQNSRKIIGFDMFGKFPRVKEEIDNEFIEKFENEAGTAINLEELKKVFEFKKFINFELVKGNILTTLDEYILKNSHIKIALLHIDVDLYEPTKYVLDSLFNKVVKGGIIMFDDYAQVSGANKAIDEFFADKDYKINKLGCSHSACYIIK